ncbi:DUF488 domain-containing protein [Gimesia sp.]|uniref:DUF488 domain-containing protein n=1 Tax=Gimesia sp. TaxID=2024833 RepID=UPI003A95616B
MANVDVTDAVSKYVQNPVCTPESAHSSRFRIRTVHVNELLAGEVESLVWCEAYNPPGSFRIDLWWFPDITPTTDLRKWYLLYPERWYEFRRRYRNQLAARSSVCEQLRILACQTELTLVYQRGAINQNMAAVIEEQLIQLECQHRWNEGLMIGGYTYPVRNEIIAQGGLWFTKHKTWMMPDRKSWESIVDMLPGDF